MRTLNMNKYNIVPEDDATLKIIPFMLADGTQPPPLFVRSVSSPVGGLLAKDLDNTEWDPAIKIDVKQEPHDYRKCVIWWFLKMSGDDLYKQRIIETYGKSYKNNLRREVQKIKNWLLDNAGYKNKNKKYTRRKTNIGQFVTTWLNKNATF